MKEIIVTRSISPLEERAYKNLKDYDGGVYQVKNKAAILEIVAKCEIQLEYTPRELDIDQQQINEFLTHAQLLNLKHADFKPGYFAERNSYEASFAKKYYFDSELVFIVSLFISHHNIHAFEDGNKRTALNLLIDLINRYTNLYIHDILIVQDAQILYLEKIITEEEFKRILYYEVRKKLFKTSMKVNLEHLIPRSSIEDSASENFFSQSDRRSSFSLNDLEKGQFFYQQLRKPIFQRDTNQWTVERLEKLILTFLDDGLIPAIILWEDQDGEIYIIDGAHRISSLIAWVNSDYGKENEFNDSNHSAIENYINNKIGSYEEIKESTDEEYRKAKQIIAKRSIAVQWVTGSYDKVKESFIRINEQGVVISEDEKELIENDQLPVSILSRAILGHGLGQKSKIQNENTDKLFNRFFRPFLSHELNNYPLAGSINENLVISKIYNTIKIIDNDKKLSIDELIAEVENVLALIQDYLNISQKVYFYGVTKLHKVNSLYGFIRFAMMLKDDQDLCQTYTEYREEFENYIILNERHVQSIARKKRQAKKAYQEIANYYKLVVLSCAESDFSRLKRTFNYLDFEPNKNLTSKETTLRISYDGFVSETPKCRVCGGYIDKTVGFNGTHFCCNDNNEVSRDGISATANI